MGHLRLGDKELRKQDAKKRNEICKKLSISQRLELLDKRLGKDIGAKKERERLIAKLEVFNEPPKEIKKTAKVTSEKSQKDKFNKRYKNKKEDNKKD